MKRFGLCVLLCLCSCHPRCDDDGTLILFSHTFAVDGDETTSPQPLEPPQAVAVADASATAEVKAAMTRLQPTLIRCYETALARSPTLSGRLAFEFDIDAGANHGRVVEVRVLSTSSLSSPEVEGCVRAALLASTDFPSPESTTTVAQSFVFAPSL
jgi:hypothetical protein